MGERIKDDPKYHALSPPLQIPILNKIMWEAGREARNVLLIYSVKESGRFAGFARLASESRRDVPSVPWVLPHGLSAKGRWSTR